MQRTVCITGATSGFGKACAERFAAEGWCLILTGRRGDRLRALKEQLSSVPVLTVELDVRDYKAVEAMVAGLPEEFKQIDVLVNNAGLGPGSGRGAQDRYPRLGHHDRHQYQGALLSDPLYPCRVWWTVTRAISSTWGRLPAITPIRAATSMGPPRPLSSSSPAIC